MPRGKRQGNSKNSVADDIEGLGAVFGNEAVDGLLEVGDAFEDAAFAVPARQLGEEHLDGVHP